MNSLLQRYITIFISIISFFVMFFFVGAQPAEACVIENIVIRNSGGSVGNRLDLSNNSNWYSDNSQPFIYFDIQTSGCDTNLRVGVVAIKTVNVAGQAIPAVNFQTVNAVGNIDTVPGTVVNINSNLINNQNGDFTVTYKAGETDCHLNQNPDCLYMLFVTRGFGQSFEILRIAGNIASGLSAVDAQTFAANIAPGFDFPDEPTEATGRTCGMGWLAVASFLDMLIGAEDGFYFQTRYLCLNFTTSSVAGGVPLVDLVHGPYSNLPGFPTLNINTAIFQYNSTRLNIPIGYIDYSSPSNALDTIQRIAFPALLYNCEDLCLGGDWSHPSGGILELGATHPADQGAISVQSVPDNYEKQYVPLAPLPFEGLNGGATPTLPAYLQGLFNAAIIIIIVLAVIMIVFAGVTHFFSASATKKEGKRELAWNAVIGLLIALGSWLLLNTISPELAANLSIQIPQVSLAGDVDSFPSQNVQNPDGSTITGSSLPTNLGLQCPLSGGVQAVPGIIESFENKVTYRFGGKGSPLPANAMFPLTPKESSGGQYMCGDVACRTFCPDNSVCLDCSGFTNQVRRCAGLPTFGGTSSMVNNPSAIAINPSDISGDGQSININDTPYSFQPGDLLVYNGHVLIYYQNGQVAESRGDMPGIQNPNSNIRISNLTTNPSKNKLTHLIKANP